VSAAVSRKLKTEKRKAKSEKRKAKSEKRKAKSEKRKAKSEKRKAKSDYRGRIQGHSQLCHLGLKCGRVAVAGCD
jgi:uncharacterized protein (DUF3084 family)